MADVFREGRDLHTETAAGVLGKTVDFTKFPEYGLSDDDRQIGKKLNFSIVYGGGVPTLVKRLGITSSEAMDLLRGYHGTWPGIGWASKKRDADPGTLLHSIKNRVETRGYITTLYGRHLHPRSMHSALNALCQGCAADLMKWAMVETHRQLTQSGLASHIVNMVHDELILDCAESELVYLTNNLPDWMTDERIESVVPIRPGCDVSFTTWADKEKVNV